MAEFSEVSPGVRIFLLALLLVVLALAGVVWFDYLGLIDARDALAPVWRLAGLRQRTGGIADDDPNLLDKERLAKEQEALVLRAEDLERSRQALAAETANLTPDRRAARRAGTGRGGPGKSVQRAGEYVRE